MQVIYKFQGFEWCQFTTRRPNIRSTKRTPPVSFDCNRPLAHTGLVWRPKISCIRHSSSYKTIHSQRSSSGVVFLKTFEHNHSMSNFGLFFFFVQMSWIFACGLRFNRKSQPCIFFRWFALHFRVKTYAKNSRLQDASLVSLFGKTIGFFCLARSTTGCKKRRRVFCIRFNWTTKRKPAEKNTGLWLSIKSETTCKNSAHLDEKKKTDQNST